MSFPVQTLYPPFRAFTPVVWKANTWKIHNGKINLNSSVGQEDPHRIFPEDGQFPRGSLCKMHAKSPKNNALVEERRLGCGLRRNPSGSGSVLIEDGRGNYFDPHIKNALISRMCAIMMVNKSQRRKSNENAKQFSQKNDKKNSNCFWGRRWFYVFVIWTRDKPKGVNTCDQIHLAEIAVAEYGKIAAHFSGTSHGGDWRNWPQKSVSPSSRSQQSLKGTLSLVGQKYPAPDPILSLVPVSLPNHPNASRGGGWPSIRSHRKIR